MNNLQTWFINKFNRYLEDILKKLNAIEPLSSAISYSILNGGKRLRPYLMFLSNFALTNDKDISFNNVINNAIAIEFIHSYSLVHDDLPCMDNDTLRRGLPTTHIKYGEGIATLVGDGMLNYAYEIMINNAKSINQIKAIRYISKQAGIYGMVGGQCMDLREDKTSYSLENFVTMNKLKTACLFRAALVGGALLENPETKILLNLELFADKIGILFQIVDDILDIESTSDILGKNVHQDAKQGKTTYIDYVGLENSKTDCLKYANEAKNIIDNMDILNKDYFYEIIETFLKRKK